MVSFLALVTVKNMVVCVDAIRILHRGLHAIIRRRGFN